ncbi:hypothetical protein [Ramlibacter tataouinensis]|uniref:Uncharacterized protein n=1 Tax=Ramlibacter tataouinensis (strain ATCC BAA-407 / DSM 14655 / LMG 21543 / TTB310) TaxID=365046 RepID=F5Y1M4_RAMTT|nr:hypothetical protein [Ramlibacter tataouinensis]AEG92275.1 hypothetical protein Rta_11890 [Ramlibacter tataouinensis TTB310]
MAKSYLFLKPATLPLVASELSADSVGPIDPGEVERSLKEAVPQLVWENATQASGEVEEGWIEFSQTGEGASRTLSLRCSLRADYTALVQRLCDRYGWVAFDDTPLCFQPHRPPMGV